LDGETIRGPVTPLGNFCLVRTKDTLTATEGGILLPDQAKERPTEGIVLAAGPGKIHPDTGVRITNPVKEGDSVLYGKFSGQPIVYNEEQCQMIRDDDVMLYYDGVSMTLDNIVPCRDYVLVELAEESLETSSGIAIAATVTKEDLPCEGIVAKVGEGRMASTGELTKPPVQVGEKVKFKDYAGNDVVIAGKPYSLVRMVDILCSMPLDTEDGEE
jgi:chaperonin GroES